MRAIQAGSRVVGLVALSKATGANDGGIWVATFENVRVTHNLVANNTNPFEASNSDVVLTCNVARASSAVFSVLLLPGISMSRRAPIESTFDLKWPVENSEGIFDATQAMHKSLTERTGGRSLPNSLWRPLKDLRTLHPLGGCVMGSSPETDIVDHLGWTSGYPNPIVADGAIVPTPTVRESFAHDRSARGAHRR
ncbi:GMC oxidoreductase [Sorangium sp. So ce117]|uniref:GMC oxidoreductase n=1 Tax=Sorangium sp. So ce117 TaxID=3133277 RepID=UPI003F613316